jgi:multisubunit Na+/H+ antiporter MnhE subunit
VGLLVEVLSIVAAVFWLRIKASTSVFASRFSAFVSMFVVESNFSMLVSLSGNSLFATEFSGGGKNN